LRSQHNIHSANILETNNVIARKQKTVKPKIIYVYVLVDRKSFTKSKDIVKHALYVGKGTGSRMSQHMNEVMKRLRGEAGSGDGANKKKIEELMKLAKAGREVQAIRISAGYLSDKDAFRAEALAITLINSARASSGASLLLNAVNGHHAQHICDMQEHFLYTQADDELLPKKPSEHAILVKTTDKEMSESQWRPLQRSFTHKGVVFPKITVCSQVRERARRRAWDPLDPWSPEEAHARAYHYWPFKTERIVSWLEDSVGRPKWLLAGVPDGNDTVVRYAWHIDWDKNWEFYPKEKGSLTGRWGVPISDANAIVQHPLLGKRLVENRDSKRVQVLKDHTSGVRVIGIRRAK
jgi:hypothetical protein